MAAHSAAAPAKLTIVLGTATPGGGFPLYGGAVVDAVREIVKNDPDAKILMCSAMGQQALVVEAIQAGAKDFVVKPFQPSRVLEAVQRVLG